MFSGIQYGRNGLHDVMIFADTQNMIAIDTTFFGHEEAKNKKLSLSTSIFTADLLDAIAQSGHADKFTLLVYYNHKEFFAERFPQYKLCSVNWWPVTMLYNLTGKKKTANKLIKKFGVYKRIVQSQNFDAIWYPYAMNQTFVNTKIKTFATVHDIYRIHNGTPKESRIFTEFLKNPSIYLISVSDYTKQDIQNTVFCSSSNSNMQGTSAPKDIPVIPNSIKFDIQAMQKPDEIEGDFILDINAYNAKKNALTLLKAFNLAKNTISHNLILCGGYKEDSYFEKIQNFISHNNLTSRVKVLFRVPDEQRNWLLHNASLFITPSVFEGFGRTPVEAAVCEVPVISTKCTSLFEATKGLCNYVENPYDEKELSDLIQKVLQNYPSKEHLHQIRETLLREYDAVSCAKKYLHLFGIQ